MRGREVNQQGGRRASEQGTNATWITITLVSRWHGPFQTAQKVPHRNTAARRAVLVTTVPRLRYMTCSYWVRFHAAIFRNGSSPVRPRDFLAPWVLAVVAARTSVAPSCVSRSAAARAIGDAAGVMTTNGYLSGFRLASKTRNSN